MKKNAGLSSNCSGLNQAATPVAISDITIT